MAAKKSGKRTSKRKKKAAAQKQIFSERVVGLILCVVSLFGIFHLGYLGVLIVNAFRLLIGDAYLIGIGLLLLFSIYLLIYGKEPQLKSRYWGGILLIILGISLGLEAIFFNKLDLHNDFIGVTWQYSSRYTAAHRSFPRQLRSQDLHRQYHWPNIAT